MKQRISFRNLSVAIEPGSTEGTATLTASRDDANVWACDIRVLGRVDELQPRFFARVVGDYLLVFSDGEHYRGATSHEQKLHCVDENGSVRFSLQLDTEGRALQVSGRLVVVHRRPRTRFPKAPDALFEIITIDADRGTIVGRTPIPLSDEIIQAMRHDQAAGFPSGKLEQNADGHRFVGRIVVGGKPMSYAVQIPR